MLSSVAWLLGEKLLRLLGGLVVGIWFARYLGPHDLGVFNYALAWVTLFGAFAWLGLGEAVVRDLVRAPEKKDEILGTVFFLRICGSVVSVSVCLIAFGVFKGDDPLLLALVAASSSAVLITEPFGTIAMWFQACTNARPVVLARNFPFFAMLAARCLLIYLEAPLVTFAWLLCVEAALTALGLAWVYRRDGGRVTTWRLDRRHLLRLLQEGLPIMLAALLASLYMRIDQIMLGDLGGYEAVGVYTAATRLSETWWMVPAVLAQALAPKLLFQAAGGPEESQRRLKKMFALMFWLALPIAVAMSFASTPLVIWLFGPRFEAAGMVLAVHAWTAIFVFVDAPASQFLVSRNLQRFLVAKSGIGLTVNVLLNFALIPQWGALGAATATVLAYGFSGFLGYWLFAETRQVGRSQVQGILLPFARERA